MKHTNKNKIFMYFVVTILMLTGFCLILTKYGKYLNRKDANVKVDNSYYKLAINNNNSNIINKFKFSVPHIIITAIDSIATNIPINTDIIELMLCLTTSVSDVASILGYFKFINNPKIAVKVGIIIEATKINNMSIIFTLKTIKKIMSLIKITGIDIILLVKTLANNIFLGATGKLFVILKLFPSNEIIEDVIDVIHDVNTTNP